MFYNANSNADLIKKSGIKDFKKYPPISGLFNVKSNLINFNMLTINSDDSSIVDRYWNDSLVDKPLDIWTQWCITEGTYIDVGAHTGLFTLAALASNQKNFLISFEPFPLNFYRMITNIRLNQFLPERFALFNKPVSDQNKNIKFEVSSPWSYLSKGGKISSKGIDMTTLKLDDIKFNNDHLDIKGIKIDTEGEDFMVLLGAKNVIEKYHPKIIIEARPTNIKDIVNLVKNYDYKKIYDANYLDFKDEKFYQIQKSKNIYIE